MFLPRCFMLFLSVIGLNQGDASRTRNIADPPIIGILAQENTADIKAPNTISFISVNYVKWLDSQGAKAVPIKINQTEEYYSAIVNSVNGLIFPGGRANYNYPNSGYGRAGAILYNLIVNANNKGDFFPVWGTCLGFQFLLYMAVGGGGTRYLARCDAYNRTDPLSFTSSASASRLFGAAPSELMTTLSTEKSTANYHNWCMTNQNFTRKEMDKAYTSLAMSDTGSNSTGGRYVGPYIAAIEAINYPFWGTQFHPELNSLKMPSVFTYFANFFVNQARKNLHSFTENINHGIYLMSNYTPIGSYYFL